VAGARTLKTYLCIDLRNVHFFYDPLIAIFMIALSIFSLSDIGRQEWAPPAIASVPPMLFLWSIASDTSRWVAFAVLGVWIVCAIRYFSKCETEPRWVWTRVGAATLTVLLLYPRTVHSAWPIFVPSPLIEKAVEATFATRTSTDLDLCDPGWRDVLNQTRD
jgi:hypothetical protein